MNLAATRIVALALISGQVVFAFVVLWMLESNGPLVGGDTEARDSLRVLSLVAIAIAVAAVPSAFLLRSQIGRRAATPQVRQAAFLAFLAILEGAGLLNLVVWWLLGPVVIHPLTAGALLAIQVVGSVKELKSGAS